MGPHYAGMDLPDLRKDGLNLNILSSFELNNQFLIMDASRNFTGGIHFVLA